VCEIILLLFGIVTMIRGKFLLSRGREVRGAMARIIGLILVLPFPLSFMLLFIASLILTVQGKAINEANLRMMGTVIELSMVALCFVSAIALAAAVAKPIRKNRADEESAVDIPQHYAERFEPELDPRSESEDITKQPLHTPSPPDGRTQN
jgi:hypothetical protein